MDERLIEEIVRRVTEKLRPLLSTCCGDDSHTLLLINYAPDLQNLLEQYAAQYGQGRTIRFIASRSVQDSEIQYPAVFQSIDILDAIKINWKRVVLPFCSLSTLAKIALGIKDNEITEMAGRALKAELQLEICTDCMDLQGFKNKAYRMLFEEHIRKVKTYGAVVKGNCFDLAAQPETGSVLQTETEAEKNVYRFENRFISEKQTRNLPEKAILMLKRGAIISPLSVDVIKNRQIDIRYE